MAACLLGALLLQTLQPTQVRADAVCGTNPAAPAGAPVQATPPTPAASAVPPAAGAAGQAGSATIRPTPAGPAAPATPAPRAALATPTARTTPGALSGPAIPAATAAPRPTQVTAAGVEELRRTTSALIDELRRIDEDLLVAAGRLRDAEDALGQVAAEIEVLEGQLAEKQAAVDARAAAYGVRLRALYKFTRTSPLEQILSARDFADMLRRVTLIQAIMRVDARLLGQLRAERDGLLAARAALQEKQRQAQALRDEIDHEQEVLATRRADQAAAVAQAQLEQWEAEMALFLQYERAQAAAIVALQAQYRVELEALERERAQEAARQAGTANTAAARAAATAQAAQATKATATARARSGGSGGSGGSGALAAPAPPLPPGATGLAFAWPVVNPVVTTEFGEPNFAQASHTGIDLAHRLYMPVVAAADGIVIACGLAVPGEPSQSYGMLVVVAHDRTLTTLYAHLEDETLPPPVKPGERVKRGQIVGYIGMTGLTTGPHLHFEVRTAGQPQDPRLYLP